MNNCWKCIIGYEIGIEGFDSEPMYNKKIFKNQIKSYDGKANTDFHGFPKGGSHCVCLLVIVIDPVFKMCKNYYLQLFLKENKMSQVINKEI